MRKVRRSRRGLKSRPGDADHGSAGSGELLRQLGQYESANGWPVSPFGIVMAIVAAAIVYPIARFVRFLVRH
jgi:hypothetical protein